MGWAQHVASASGTAWRARIRRSMPRVSSGAACRAWLGGMPGRRPSGGWAAGLLQMGYQCDPSLLQQLPTAFFSKLRGQLLPHALVTLAVGLAGLGYADPEGWRRLRAAAHKLLPSMEAKGVAQLLWAFSTARQQVCVLRSPCATLLLAWAPGIHACLAIPQAGASAIPALAMLHLPWLPCLASTTLRTLRMPHTGMRSAIPPCLQDAELCTAAAARLRHQLEKLQAAEIVAVVRGCMAAGCEDQLLFEEAAAVMVRLAERAGQQQRQQRHQQQAEGEAAGPCQQCSAWAAQTLQRLDPVLCIMATYQELLVARLAAAGCAQ